ncbi:1465_t:CDS:1, partial [Acaulospora colombiana]
FDQEDLRKQLGLEQTVQFEQTICNTIVITKVWIGLILGRTAKDVSPTRPLEVDSTPDCFTSRPNPNRLTALYNESATFIRQIANSPSKRTRSRAVTKAHTLGAQYAWLSPLVNGKRRDRTCGICL